MKVKFLNHLGQVSLVVGLLMCNSVIHAADNISGKVINLAGKQRMLTQKMSKEALLVAKGVDAQANAANLQKTAALFDKTLNGLKMGDADLGLAKTDNADIVKQLDHVASLWANFKPLVDGIAAGEVNTDTLTKIANSNIPLLKEMNKAVQMYEKAAGSTLSPEVATAINLAGKQRMLTQKMTKELLLVANAIAADENKANLAKTIALFSKTLKGLFDGDADLGLVATKNEAIRAQLMVVQKLWDEYKTVLDKVDVSDAGLQAAAKINLPLLKEMNKAVGMYK